MSNFLSDFCHLKKKPSENNKNGPIKSILINFVFVIYKAFLIEPLAVIKSSVVLDFYREFTATSECLWNIVWNVVPDTKKQV